MYWLIKYHYSRDNLLVCIQKSHLHLLHQKGLVQRQGVDILTGHFQLLPNQITCHLYKAILIILQAET